MPDSFRLRLLRLFALGLTVGGALLIVVGSANDAVALTTSPVRLEVTQDPGTTQSYTIKLDNEERQSRTLYVSYQNFEADQDESGNPRFVPGNDGLVGWIKGPSVLTVGPGGNTEVTFQVTVPRNAEPGGYFAGIFFNSTPPSVDGTGVGIGSQQGVLLLLRVNGDVTEQAGILEFATKDKQRFFAQLPVEFYFRFQNSGDDRVKPLGDAVIKNTFRMKSKVITVNYQKGNVLPKSIRRFEFAWTEAGGQERQSPEAVAVYPELSGFWQHAKYQATHFALGYYSADLTLAYGNSSDTVSTAGYGFFVFPWQLVAVAGATLLIFIVVLRFTLRRYNRHVINKYGRR